jgi:aspartate-semialdehyde dehydrogenase
VPLARQAGCAVVDKSNAFRLDPLVPLVVDGINEWMLDANSDLAANPNCSTIILAHTLEPLLQHCGLSRVWVATYQSVSGAGGPGVDKLTAELHETGAPDAMLSRPDCEPGTFAYNVVPGIGKLDALGRCGEETKLVEETRKILDRPTLPVIAHAVRVPVVIGHSMAVTVELEWERNLEQILAAWGASPHLRLMDAALPGPISSAQHDQVEIGRVRAEPQLEHGWSFFIAGDNLRLGAALNGYRIMRRMIAAGSLHRYATAAGGANA